MRKSKSFPIVVVGLVTGLIGMMPIAFAKDRDDIPRVKAANATFAAIDFPGAPSTAALDINSAGEIVGRYPSTGSNDIHGFLRNVLGQFTTIDFPNALVATVFTVAAGINSRGHIVGQYRLDREDANVRHGFLRSREGTFITIDPPQSHFTNALGINRRGDIVGRFCTGPMPSPPNPPCTPGAHHGFLLRGPAFTTIDFPGAVRTDAWGINDRGEIVGGYQDTNNKSHIFRLRKGQFKTIDFPGVFDTAPDGTKGGINSRGDIVSYYCAAAPCSFNNDSQHGFLLSDHEFTTTMDFPATTINSLPGHVTANFAINARGDIVGIYHDASGTDHGFLLKLEERDEDED